MSVDFSTFKLPNEQDYERLGFALETFIKNHSSRVEGVIYGSSANKPKSRGNSFRLGFSDMDVFLVAKGDDVIPDFSLLQKYATVLLPRKHDAIKIQTHWTTEAILGSPISPGEGYIGEVLTATPGDHGLREILERSYKPNTYINDDIAMMAHFLRKVMQATINIRKVRAMDHADVTEIAKLYEGYKRIFSIMTLFVRIRRGKFGFQSTKLRILSTFEGETGITLDHDVLLAFDSDTRNTRNWSADFYRKDLDQLLEYFALIYAEFEKVMEAIVKTQVKVRKIETHTW